MSASTPPDTADRPSPQGTPPLVPSLGQVIGPGLLFAGAAIGVSHLVQSTRAGALYGLALIPVVLLANLMKYPALAAGPRFSLATGRSLIEAYRVQGWHAIGAFAIIQLGTAFAIHAAISAVTGSVLIAALALAGVELSLLWAVVLINVLATALLATGGFALLDACIKVLMTVLALATLVVTSVEVRALDLGTLTMPVELWLAPTTIAFAVALAGWMPAPLDIAAWNSLWCVEKHRKHGTPSSRHAMLDFNIGMAACVLLAVCFVVLGTARLNAEGIEPAASGGAFAAQIITLYTGALGNWSGPLVALGALAVMGSTLLTVADAIPRTAVATVSTLRGGHRTKPDRDAARTPGYWVLFAVMQAGGLGLLFVVGGLSEMVDLATTLSFIATPLLAWFNHRAMRSHDVPEEHRQGRLLTALSWLGIVFWFGFAGLFLWTRFGGTP
ncbi:MAG: divalent metal cation transporter [Planctomycetota bacterium]